MPSSSTSSFRRTVCHLDVSCHVPALAYDAKTNSCLAASVINGAHVFYMNDAFYGANLFSGMFASSVETYPHSTFGDDPFLCCCFAADGEAVVMGTLSGSVTTASRRSRALTASFTMPESKDRDNVKSDIDNYLEGGPSPAVRSLAAIPQHAQQVLACTKAVTSVVDIERSVAVASRFTPRPRSIGAVPLSAFTFATACADGKVLIYDTRDTPRARVVMALHDQITCIAHCPETHRVCVGSAGGRVFTLRCADGTTREEAFGTGRYRSSVSAIAVHGHRIAVGDLSGTLSLVDSSDVPDDTRQWRRESMAGSFSGTCTTDPRADACEWLNAEVTAVALAKSIAWASFCAPDGDRTQVIAVPA